MPVTVGAATPVAGEVVEAVYEDLHLVDRIFSTYKAESQVSRFNRGELAIAEADPLLAEVLDLCRRYERLTEGAFSAWAPGGRLDPSGLVKGWALARAAAILEASGCRSYFVDGAGDLVARGGPWRVGIRHPVERDRLARVIAVSDAAVATSGTYERGAHLYDPRSGGEARSPYLSLTVVAPDIVAADVFATAAFVMGEAGLAFVAAQPGCQAYAIGGDLRATLTEGFPEAV